jgi:trimeric autotransporter adhesin
MSITGITIIGSNSGDFARTTTCGSTLAINASCTINVTFRPTAVGTRTASVSIADNAPGTPHTVSLSGTGTGVSVTPTSLTFATQTVGTTSAAQTVTVRNVDTTILTGISVSDTGTNAGDFNQTTTCGTSLSVGSSCTISVTFRPTARFTRTASLRVSDSDPTSPQQVSLTGNGR